MATPIVLDTSVAVAWFFSDERERGAATDVRAHIRSNPRTYVVPPLFYSELLHVAARRSHDDTNFVIDVVTRTLDFGLRTLGLSGAAYVRAAEWCCTGLGGYDATFVALAEELGGRWLTLDRRAARRAQPIALTVDEWEGQTWN